MDGKAIRTDPRLSYLGCTRDFRLPYCYSAPSCRYAESRHGFSSYSDANKPSPFAVAAASAQYVA